MRKSFILLSLTASLIACDNDTLPVDAYVDSRIEVVPLEYPVAGATQLGLRCRTEKTYPCSNYSIVTELTYSENKISATFVGIHEMDICLTALGPASTVIDLSDVSNGEYELELNNGVLKNHGRLIISDSEIILDFQLQRGIEIIRKTTKRIPDHTYWGTVGYHSESSLARVNEFLRRLKRIQDVVAFNDQIPGEYSFYEIGDDSQMIPDPLSGYHFAANFIFQFHGDQEQFKEELELLTTPYYDEMFINIQTVDGDRIYNWD